MTDYLTRTVPTAQDPVAVAARLAASAPGDGPYVMYEDETGLSCALGALVEVTAGPDRVSVRRDDGRPTSAAPGAGGPLPLVDSYLRSVDLTGWRAYGTAGFELALLHAGLPAEALHGQVPKAGLPPTFRKAA